MKENQNKHVGIHADKLKLEVQKQMTLEIEQLAINNVQSAMVKGLNRCNLIILDYKGTDWPDIQQEVRQSIMEEVISKLNSRGFSMTKTESTQPGGCEETYWELSW